MKKILFFLLIGSLLHAMEHDNSTASAQSTDSYIKAVFEGPSAHMAIPASRVILRLSDSILTINLANSFEHSCQSKSKRPKAQLKPMIARSRKSQRVSKPTQKYAEFLATIKKK